MLLVCCNGGQEPEGGDSGQEVNLGLMSLVRGSDKGLLGFQIGELSPFGNGVLLAICTGMSSQLSLGLPFVASCGKLLFQSTQYLAFHIPVRMPGVPAQMGCKNGKGRLQWTYHDTAVFCHYLVFLQQI